MAVIFGFAPQDLQLIFAWWLMTLLLYILLRNVDIPIGKSKVFDQFTLSLLHALTMVCLGYDLVLHNDNVWFYGGNTEEQEVILCVAFGHMLADIMITLHNLKVGIWNNQKKTISQSVTYLIHHSLIIAFIIAIFKSGRMGMLMCYLFVVYDVSSIFYALRNMLRDIGMKQHMLTKVFEILFALIFIASRIGLGTAVIGWSIFMVKECPLSIKILLIIFQTLNYYWTYLLIKMMLSKKAK